MLANKNSLHRRLQIVELVRKRGEVSVDELSQAFDVSSVTIRSDLSYLEAQRYLVRSFGKARYLAQQPAASADSARGAVTAPDAERKSIDMAIARAAADFIDDHASLFIGAGVVTHKLLPLLADRSNLALTLHDLAMVATAQRFVNCELRLTGGALEGDSTILTGPDAERSVGARPLDIALIEASGIGRDGNLVCADARLAPVFRAALKASKCRVALSYRPEIGEGEAVCRLSELDGIVIDDAIEPALVDAFQHAGLHMHRREEGVVEFRPKSESRS
ncbi:DeoR/GlpR family DNA-binding transcription regulator [Caballeronia humi]|uniref:DeoR family transcriptional regulator n=1 Tax=Caballeronia humi TaxID=326474 RepID=A0A158ETQ0_9BURK|nr:DeoR/GlpR family DNA-binding transcription regulator [Caballeronia humi]SAL10853.1 DeoR family transcriptional regulator [Caballeronia humi]